MLGGWNINVLYDAMPQKVATAIGKLGDLLGVEYEIVAYLGSQQVNGINHAVLAEQILTTGRDTKNAVILIFNERGDSMEASLVGVERILESGAEFGGTNVNVTAVIPADVQVVWDEAFEGWTGTDNEIIALLGTQVVNGMNYIFLVKQTDVTPEAASRLKVVTINPTKKQVVFGKVLENKQEVSLGYAFTW